MSGNLTLVPSLLFRTRAFLCGLVAVGIFAFASTAWSMTDLYQLTQSTGSPTNMTGSTQIYGGGVSYSTLPTTYSIGFNFKFDNATYSTFSVNTSGLMSLGTGAFRYPYCYYWTNQTSLTPHYPLIAGYWLYYGAPKSGTGKVHYKVTGTAPNRVLTVEWLNVYSFNGTSTSYPGGTWQVRLYEGTNIIESWYGSMAGTSNYPASIGIAAGRFRYINVWGNDINEYHLYPNGQYSFYRYINTYPMTVNRTFEFAPCDKNLDTLIGNTAEGGSARMQNGDVLLTGKQVLRGNTDGFQPFSIEVPASPCAPFTYTATFSGSAAADYSISPANGTVITDGLMPTLNFTPGGVGERQATMTLRFNNGQVYTYALRAEGVSRIEYTGDVAEGGTSTMVDGETIMSNVETPRLTSEEFAPFTVTNINAAPSVPSLANAALSLTLLDTFDQYQLGLQKGNTITWSTDGTTESIVNTLAPGEVATVVIRMHPNADGNARGTGYQGAYLTVTADQEVRSFHIQGYSVAPAVRLEYEGENLRLTDRRLLRGEFSCVGTEALGGAFQVTNVNRVPVTITSMDVFASDDEVRQGTSPYKLLADDNGDPIPMRDYFLSTRPQIAPVLDNDIVELPLTLQPGESHTLYLGFVAQRPGRRYGRVFLHTSAVNFTGKDDEAYMPAADLVGAPEQEGILVLDMYASGNGSDLSSDAEGNLADLTMSFPSVKVGQPSETEVMLYNTGDCDLLIRQSDIRLMAGDVEDFEILEVLPNTPVNAQGDFVIPPGGSDKISGRFLPIRSGSHRATVMLRTNDSTLIIDGVSDRGIHYLDFYGYGKAYLEARVARLMPAVIDANESSAGTVSVTNASTEAVLISEISISGPDAADFILDPARPWPALPLRVQPTEIVDLGFLFAPAPGSAPGPRNAMINILASNGETVSVPLKSIAGTRTLSVTPTTLFEGVTVAAGSFARQNVIVTNSGTFPANISAMPITGAGAAAYTVPGATTFILSPGESRFIEVMYTPSGTGASDAIVTIMSNATNGDQVITLSGAGATTRLTGDPNGSTMQGADGQGAARMMSAGGMRLSAAQPNPAEQSAELSYGLAADGEISLVLFDSFGRMVTTLAEGWQESGSHVIRMNLEGLAGGVYYYRLRQGEQELIRQIRVVR